MVLERVFDAAVVPVVLRVEEPRPDGADFRCEYAIEGAGMSQRLYGMGVDPIQALLLALKAAHLDLLFARRDQGLALSWLGMRDLGLPWPGDSTAADFNEPPG